jgi:hypothetical protein
MASWLPRVVSRVRRLASERRVRFTLKAQRELAVLGLDALDGCAVLANLATGDAVGRLHSDSTGEWMYVFRPAVPGGVIYLKLILRNDCIVVSFHEDEGGRDEEEDS